MRTHSTLPGSNSFLILLALAAGPSSGADIQQQIVADTLGVYIKNPTLYKDIRYLLADGFAELVALHGNEKIITLTKKGQKRLEQEAKLLQMMAHTARARVL